MRDEDRQKLYGAWVDLLATDPFSSSILMGCRQVLDEQSSVTKTMATDGDTLWVSPLMVEAESRGALATVLAHEALHIAALHPYRQSGRKAGAWNNACDKEVNGLLDELHPEWPELAKPIMPEAGQQGMAAEQMYVAPPDGGGGAGDDPQDGMGGVRQPADAGNDPGKLAEAEARAKMRVAQAAEVARQQGKLPAALARLVETVINPPRGWREILREFVRERANDDYSWSHPNTRYAHTGFILPSLRSQRLGRVAVAIDTSGSIDQDMVDAFAGELESLMHECQPERVIMIDCDAAVQSVRELDPWDAVPRDHKGGGGTSHLPVWAALAGDPPACCVCLTDMETEFGQDPGFPVLWVTTSDTRAPFGRTVKI